MRRALMLGVTAAVAAVLAGVAALGARADARPSVLRAGNPAGIVFAHGSSGNARPHGKSPDLIWHNGDVMHSGADVTPIFWGSSWAAGDDEVTGLGDFYAGVGGTSYLGTTTEYTDSSGHVSDGVISGSALFDGSSAPRRAPSTSAVLAVVDANIAKPVANGYYPVYSDQPRGHANYCAWHSWGTINGVLVQFAFFFKLDSDPGCDPGDDTSGNSQGLAALANVSGHELSEALTDPHGDGWYDSSGEENADKCAWTFSGNLLSFGKRQWKIQGNWSNAAYDNGGTGYDGSGCIDGS